MPETWIIVVGIAAFFFVVTLIVGLTHLVQRLNRRKTDKALREAELKRKPAGKSRVISTIELNRHTVIPMSPSPAMCRESTRPPSYAVHPLYSSPGSSRESFHNRVMSSSVPIEHRYPRPVSTGSLVPGFQSHPRFSRSDSSLGDRRSVGSATLVDEEERIVMADANRAGIGRSNIIRY